MKVILVISGLMFGGGQRVVADLMGHMVQAGLQNTRICLLGHKTTLFDRFDPEIVGYDGCYNRLDTLLGTARRLRSALLVAPPDILHTHGWDADIIGWLAIKGTAIKQITHLHVTPDWLESQKFKHLLRRWLTRVSFSSKNNTLAAVSGAVQRYWVKHLPYDEQNIHVIRNGIDVYRYAPPDNLESRSNKVPVIGVAARLAPMKGIEYLVDALGVLAREGLGFRLEIAGTGELRASLEKRCRDVGIDGQTAFLGHVEDMPGFYSEVDLYILPSVSTEGLPLSVLEAMATGLPVLATTVGGTPEAVRNGVDGLLVPPRDVDALVNALQRLLRNPVERINMGNRARARVVEAFSLERFSSEIIALYQSILDSRPS